MVEPLGKPAFFEEFLFKLPKLLVEQVVCLVNKQISVFAATSGEEPEVILPSAHSEIQRNEA
jgi:hypothetical protein